MKEIFPKWAKERHWKDLNWEQSSIGGACFCTGPQNGEPLCRCQMQEKHRVETSLLVDGITINGRRYRLVEEK